MVGISHNSHDDSTRGYVQVWNCGLGSKERAKKLNS